ncbi:MAG: amidase [Betaproteobacteria bacterium]|nr:amidase [Betaproteobacteria bacterium]
MPTSPNEWTASEIATATRSGSLTCEAVIRACLERILAREPAVQAWQHLDAERALEQARALDAGSGPRGALHGVPFGAKDIIDAADMPSEYGSPIHRGHRPGRDAACVALMRRAGAVLVGKTVTTEFANVHPGKTRNPLDAERTPGGSSSGSAAAVGDRMVPLALGTQTTASTIRPASFCGVVGYRPTWGDLRMSGVLEAAGSLDTLGLFARSIEDVALLREVLIGAEPKPLEETGKPRIGFCRTPLWEKADASTQRLLEDAASTLARTGTSVKDALVPAAFARIPDAHRAVSSYEFTRNFAWEIDHHWNAISETLRNGRLAHGMATSFEQYREAREFLAACRRTLDQVFESYDVLLTPAAAGEAPIGLESTGYTGFCTLWTSTHVPAVTVPALQGPNGLPIGVQLIARRDCDRELFRFARWVQRALA